MTRLGTSVDGYVRGTGLAPRDSTPTVAWSLDRSGSLLSPNADGVGDALVVAARFSEPVTATLKVRNKAGSVVRSQTSTGEMPRFAWNLRDASGTTARDGSYTWSLRAKDAWGNAGVAANGAFTLDDTAPASTPTAHSTAGAAGWRVSPVVVSIAARDGLSGVRTIQYRIGSGAIRTYGGPVTVSANGSTGLDYRAVDRAGIREPWRHLAFRIDTVAPTIGVAMTGKAGDVVATWRGPVTLKPAIADATSGVATKLVRIDGKAAKALKAATVAVDGDGTHTVTFSATDAAGNQSSTTRTFRIDTIAPTVTPAIPGRRGWPAPDGDPLTATASRTRSRSPSPSRSTHRHRHDRRPERQHRPHLHAAGHGSRTVTWDGRSTTGKAVPDGRYTIALGRDAAGNVGAASPSTSTSTRPSPTSTGRRRCSTPRTATRSPERRP